MKIGSQRDPRTRRAIAAVVALAAAALAVLASTHVVGGRRSSSRSLSTTGEPRSLQLGRRDVVASLMQTQPQQSRKRKRLLSLTGRGPAAIALAPHYLAWEYEQSKAHPLSALMEGDRRTGKIRELASAVLPQFGLASTRTYVVYAGRNVSGSDLRAVRHDGSHRVVLSRSLAAPLASRGDMIAWAEQLGAYQRVVVRNMATGHEWVAARMPRCRRDTCYRIDGVTLADDGVVFDRGAIGTQPSLIVRRRFGKTQPSRVSVKNDPQPDLAPSSAGAFYYWLQHGWMRWDFRARRSQRTGLDAQRWWVVGYEHGRLLLRTGSQCRPRLIVRQPGKRPQAVPAPASAPGSPKDFGPLCRLMTGFAWQGRRLVVAWAVLPRISLNSHTDVGLAGVVVETLIS